MTHPAVILVDGSSYLFRAFHALPPLATSQGQPTGAIRGVINMLGRLRRDHPDSNLVVVFDAPGKTFRHEQYSDYKANRPPMPDDLRVQIKPLHQFIEALGLPLIMVPGVEADDVIGTLAKQLAADSKDVLISTGDKDLAQLVDNHITLVDTMHDKRYDPQSVMEKFGVPPELIIDYLALMGDKADNIPGVPGVGKKTACALLNQLGSIDTIYDNLDKVPTLDIRGAKSLAKKLADHVEQAKLSYQLATIKLDCELPPEAQNAQLGAPDEKALAKLLQQLEFKSLGAEWGVEAGESETPAPAVADYETVLEQAAFDQWLVQLKQAERFAFDTETTSLDYMQAEIVGVSVALLHDGVIKAAYIPVAHDYPGAPDQLERQAVLKALQPLLEDPQQIKILQNAKYDMSVLANYDIALAGIEDTMLASYVLNSTASRHDMDSLAKTYLQRSTISFESVAGKGKKQLTFNQVGLEEAAPYAAEDADITLALQQTLEAQLADEGGLKSVLTDLELPLVPVLSRMERHGAYIDQQMLREQSQSLAVSMQTLEQQAYEEAGEHFNLASTKQLREILYDKLELPVTKKTPKGAPSTAEAVLSELAQDYALPRIILDYRGLAKLKNTYTDKLPLLVNPRTGRLHTSYHQAVASTGRL